MARDGITKHQVQQVRNELIAQGRHPSVELVRSELGSGSNTTILKYLRELEVDEKGRLDNLSALSDELGQFVGHLAQRLQEEAMQRIKTTEERHHLVIAERQRQLDVLRQELMAISEHRDKLEHQHREALAQIEELKHARHEDALQLSSMTSENRHLSGTIQDKEKHIQSLEEKHTHARHALEHYRESVKTQREQEQHRHDHQVQQLQAELRLSHQALSVKQQECTTLKEQTQQQSAELHHATQSVSKIEQQLLGSQNSQQQTEQQLYRKDTELNRLQKQHEDLQQQYAAAAAKVASLQANEQAWLQEKAALSASLSTQQQLWQTFSTVNAISTPAQYAKGEDVIVVDADHALYDRIGQVERCVKKGSTVKYSVNFDGETYTLPDRILRLA
ncbi:cointegrate resolution protein T [Shewanella sp. W3-18-1]|jgi:chromosome segregation ATPase|nr:MULTISPECIES: DNA-binding protein [Gammaproteobacteria]ABM24858.1 cointegrate resolution protein T [Shewanella sp. W3-18-1]